MGLPVKLHAEQLSNLGGAALAARYGALSVDHIEYLDEAGVMAIAKSGTVAVLLPGAFYYLREKQAPPVAQLRAHHVPIAIATDLNPGSSPVHSLLTDHEHGLRAVRTHAGGSVARRHARMRPARSASRIAARSRPALRADLALWDVERPGDLAYPLGVNPCACVLARRRSGAGASHMNEPQPLYAKVKDHILLHIRSGAWAPGARVPSENELVESFGISRMTANRALRELTADGFLARVPGVGTFVREAAAGALEPRRIAQHRRGDRRARAPARHQDRPSGGPRRDAGARRGIRKPAESAACACDDRP